jgi:hypothetical protein
VMPVISARLGIVPYLPSFAGVAPPGSVGR